MDERIFTKAAPAQTPGVRIGDAERQAATHQLQQHFAEGRLTWEELDERLAVAYAARVNADLEALFTDLPMLAPPPAPPRTRTQLAAATLGSWDVRRLLLVGLAVAVAALVTRGLAIPVVLIWWFLASSRPGRHGSICRRQQRHHHPHEPHHHGKAQS